MMKTVTTREAQHHLSRVLDFVDNGEKVVITRKGGKAYTLDVYEEENIREKAVDWNNAIEEMDQRLGHLPKFNDSIVEIMRAEERY